MTTDVRISVLKNGRIVDERWLGAARGLSLRDLVVGAHANSKDLLVERTKRGVQLHLPVGVPARFSGAGGGARDVAGRIELDASSRGYIDLDESRLLVQAAMRPPPPPARVLPRDVRRGALAAFEGRFALTLLAVLLVEGAVAGWMWRTGRATLLDFGGDDAAESAGLTFRLPPPKVPPVVATLAPVRTPAPRARPAAQKVPERAGNDDERRRKVRGAGVLPLLTPTPGSAIASVLFAGPDETLKRAIDDVKPVNLAGPISPAHRAGQDADAKGLGGIAGGIGRDSGIALGPHKPAAPPKEPPMQFAPIIDPPPGLTPGQFARLVGEIKERMRAVQQCLESSLGRYPTLTGRLDLDLVVSPEGRVLEPRAEFAAGGMGGEEVERCVERRARSWKLSGGFEEAITLSLPVMLQGR